MECRNRVFELVRLLTFETKEEQQDKFLNDMQYKIIIDHLTHTYFLIETNPAFKEEQEIEKLKFTRLFGKDLYN